MPEYEDMDAPAPAPIVEETPAAPVEPEPVAEPAEPAEPAEADEAEASRILAEEEAQHKPKTGSARLKAQRDEARIRADQLAAEVAQLKASQQPKPIPSLPGIPTLDQFITTYPSATLDDFESFKSAKILEEAEQRVMQRIKAEQQNRDWDEGVRKAKEEIPDLDEHEDIQALVSAGVNLQATPIPAAILRMGPDVGPRMLHHLAKNPNEARRIAGLPPIDAAVELGALKAALVSKATKPAPKPSSAPPPLTPVRSSGASTSRAYANQEDF